MKISMAQVVLGTEEDRELFIDQEVLRAACARQIFCPYTNRILDMGRDVYVEYKQDGQDYRDILHADAWDAARERFTAHPRIEIVKVTDGRELQAKLKERAKARKAAAE